MLGAVRIVDKASSMTTDDQPEPSTMMMCALVEVAVVSVSTMSSLPCFQNFGHWSFVKEYRQSSKLSLSISTPHLRFPARKTGKKGSKAEEVREAEKVLRWEREKEKERGATTIEIKLFEEAFKTPRYLLEAVCLG